MLPLEWKNIDHKRAVFFNDQKWTKNNTHKENTTRCKKRLRKRDHRCSLSFFCCVLLERRERNRDCFYGNGYISVMFLEFFVPFLLKNGPKMTPHNTKKTHSWEGRRIARKSDYDERETTGADVLRRKTTTERRRRRRTTTPTKSRSS